jgi:hypothetical protein
MKLWQFVLIWLLLIVAIAVFTGCTTVFEGGKPVLRISSNAAGVRYASPAGTTFEATRIDNSSVHRTIGSNIGSAAVSVGSAIATSGIVK